MDDETRRKIQECIERESGMTAEVWIEDGETFVLCYRLEERRSALEKAKESG